MASKRPRIVVKIGTGTLSGPDGAPERAFLGRIADAVAQLRADGDDVLLVSSGAIGSGRALLGAHGHKADVTLRQAYAAVGQARLVRAWEEAFRPHDLLVAQILLTQHNFTRRQSFLNLRNATERLLALGVVPVINENDVVSIDEIDASFGDNDRLCAMVAAKVGARLLVILSDVAGLYTKPPGRPGAQLIPLVEEIRPELYEMAKGGAGARGTGGMHSKLDAARIATRAGIPVVIASGQEPDVLVRLARGEPVGTLFAPHGTDSLRDQWLRMAHPAGRIHVDAGAAAALHAGKHLLPAGIVRVEGTFATDAVVEIVHADLAVAKAVTELSSRDLEAVRGKRSAAIADILGRSGPFNVTRKKKVVLVAA